MWKQVLPLFVIAVVVGWMMPAQEPAAKNDAAPQTVQPPVNAVAKDAPVAAVADDAPAEFSDGTELVLNRAENGHYYAEGNADGAAVRFMVDTGATVVALTASDAESLGIYVTPNELSVVGRGVNGEVSGKNIMIKRLTLGQISADNVPAVIIPEGLPVSLLGQSFLSRIGHVTISDNRMTLKN
jgi:aspartyl protease family protein